MKKIKASVLTAVFLLTSLVPNANYANTINGFKTTNNSAKTQNNVKVSKLVSSQPQKNTNSNNINTDNTENSAGVKPITKEEEQWKEKNMINTKQVALNKMGLERVNEARVKKGLKPIDSTKAVGLGNEVISGDSTQLTTALSEETDNTTFPAFVDNSNSIYFPPIGNQGPSAGSCVAFSTTYYQATYMNAFARNIDLKHNPDPSNIFSPKWTFNLTNNGDGSKSSFIQAYKLLKEQGIATQHDFEYPSPSSTLNYLEWPTSADTWKNAANVRADKEGYIEICDGTNTPVTPQKPNNLNDVKKLINDKYILSCSVDLINTDYTTIKDPYTGLDAPIYYDSYSTSVCHGHMVTIVGYNDDIWLDLNKNGKLDDGEKGAFQVANSYGTSSTNNGFFWVAYDALNSVSSVLGASGSHDESRVPFFGAKNDLYWMTVKTSTPKLLAQVDISTSNRSELQYQLGCSETSEQNPTITWQPMLNSCGGGDCSFNGTNSAPDGTSPASDGVIVLNYDYLINDSSANSKKRWYIKITDNKNDGVISTIKDFKIIDPVANIETKCSDSDTNKQINGNSVTLSIDYQLNSTSQDSQWTLKNNFKVIDPVSNNNLSGSYNNFKNSISYNDKIYTLCKYNSTDSINKYEILQYDPALDKWTTYNTKCNYNMDNINNSILINDKVYYYESGTSILYIFDITKNTWSYSSFSTPLQMGGYNMVGLNGKIYLIGGTKYVNNAWVNSNDVWEYDPSIKSWTLKANIPCFTTNGQALAANGSIYIIGGEDQQGVLNPKVQKYDPATNVWSNDSSIPVFFDALSGYCINVGNKIYILDQGGIYYYEYDTINKEWTVNSFTKEFDCKMLQSSNNKLYTLNGNNVLEFNPSINASSSDNFTYTLNGNNATITGYSGEGGNVIIPWKINGYNVTSVGDNAFKYCNNITGVYLQGNITSVGKSAFEKCTNLNSVIISTSVTSIGDNAFEYCTSLNSIYIPSSVTSIGNSTFKCCTNLTQINVDNNSNSYYSENGVLYNKAKTTLISYPTGKTDSSFIVPSDIQNLQNVSDDAFYDCANITSITIPNSVTNIGNSAFGYCTKLTGINLPSNLTSIGNFMFNSCYNLSNIVIPNNVTNIGIDAFYNCANMRNLTIPNSVTSIGSGAFFGSGLTNITIPSSVTDISNDTFSSCSNLTNVSINGNMRTIGDYAFNYCTGLQSINIPSTVTKIGDYAFDYCTNLQSITIPSSLTSLGESAFENCSKLANLTISSGLTCIDNCTFKNCGLTSVTIPNSVTTIGNEAFENCVNLASATIPNSVTSLGESAFSSCGLTSIIIPSSIKIINSNVFFKCTSLASVTIPSSVTSIGCSAFYNCSKLTNVTIPNSVTSIGLSAFSSCGLTSLVIPNSLTSIDGSFSYCTSLTSVTIPNSVTSIANNAFCNCSALSKVYFLENQAPNVDQYAFYNCPSTLLMYYLNGSTGFSNPWNGYNTVATTTFDPSITLSPTTALFSKASPANITVAITALNKSTNPIVGVYNGSYRLVAGTNEAVTPTTNGYSCSIYQSYLNNLPTGTNTITFKFSNGTISTFTINVINSNMTLSPTTVTVDKAAPANIPITITAPNKSTNPVTGVYNGTYRLVACTDEAVTTTTDGYSCSIYQSYLNNLPVGTNTITFKFKNGDILNLTINVINSNKTLSLTSVTFTKVPSIPDITVNITVPDKSTDPLTGVYYGTYQLVEGTDESLTDTNDGYSCSFHHAFLNNLPDGTSTITFKFQNGDILNLTLKAQ